MAMHLFLHNETAYQAVIPKFATCFRFLNILAFENAYL